MPPKHIFYVHGRNTKPTPAVFTRQVKLALGARLRRVNNNAADVFESDDTRFTVAYYGDLMNELMVQAQPELTNVMLLRSGKWIESHGHDAASLEQLIRRPTRKHRESDYKELVGKHRNRRFLSDVARLFGPVGSITGFTTYAIKRMFPDFGAYLTTRKWSSQIRARLQGKLRRALARGDDVAVIAHSMGCIVSYDVLWKLSRIHEHRNIRDRKISLWLTLGCPLGERSIRNELYDSDEPDDGLYPANITKWVNIAANDDFVTQDGTVADDFREMLERGLVQSIKDLPRIHTFWVGSKGSNPHKSFGYLNHPTVARTVAKWLLQ